jgi:hypothetical protein
MLMHRTASWLKLWLGPRMAAASSDGASVLHLPRASSVVPCLSRITWTQIVSHAAALGRHLQQLDGGTLQLDIGRSGAFGLGSVHGVLAHPTLEIDTVMRPQRLRCLRLEIDYKMVASCLPMRLPLVEVLHLTLTSGRARNSFDEMTMTTKSWGVRLERCAALRDLRVDSNERVTVWTAEDELPSLQSLKLSRVLLRGVTRRLRLPALVSLTCFDLSRSFFHHAPAVELLHLVPPPPLSATNSIQAALWAILDEGVGDARDTHGTLDFLLPPVKDGDGGSDGDGDGGEPEAKKRDADGDGSRSSLTALRFSHPLPASRIAHFCATLGTYPRLTRVDMSGAAPSMTSGDLGRLRTLLPLSIVTLQPPPTLSGTRISACSTRASVVAIAQCMCVCVCARAHM